MRGSAPRPALAALGGRARGGWWRHNPLDRLALAAPDFPKQPPAYAPPRLLTLPSLHAIVGGPEPRPARGES